MKRDGIIATLLLMDHGRPKAKKGSQLPKKQDAQSFILITQTIEKEMPLLGTTNNKYCTVSAQNFLSLFT